MTDVQQKAQAFAAELDSLSLEQLIDSAAMVVAEHGKPSSNMSATIYGGMLEAIVSRAYLKLLNRKKP